MQVDNARMQPIGVKSVSSTYYPILFAISLVHLFNDSIQSVIPAIFPILKDSMDLSFFQVGMIAFTLNVTASVMQPVVGLYTDAKPSPFLLPAGMVSTFLGMLGLAYAPNFGFVLLSVVFVGLGSAVFHPEASRVAHLAAGDRRGLAQSIYQVGGNSGQSLAPIMTALIFVPLGQFGAIWFTLVAAAAITVNLFVARWYGKIVQIQSSLRKKSAHDRPLLPKRKKQIIFAMFIVVTFVFARTWYHSGITNFYAFFLMDEYGIKLDAAQIYIFLFLAAGAVGTFLGGPMADRFGKRNVMLFSMLGSAPFALILPHVNLYWAYVISLLSGFIILSSFSVLVVYAQELLPGRIGLVSGLILGLAFGMGAIGSATLGGLADLLGISAIIKLSAFLPFFGFLAFLLPSDTTLRQWAQEAEAEAED